MTKPRFVCSTYDVSPEHPSDWEFNIIEGKSNDTTLDGTIVKDLAWYKFGYVLTWEAMSVEDFDDLIELYLYHQVNGSDLTFTYDKFPQSESGVKVSMEMPSRSRTGGSGNTNYYSQVKINLVEIAKRS